MDDATAIRAALHGKTCDLGDPGPREGPGRSPAPRPAQRVEEGARDLVVDRVKRHDSAADALAGADMSSFVSPRPVKRRCRAKAIHGRVRPPGARPSRRACDADARTRLRLALLRGASFSSTTPSSLATSAHFSQTVTVELSSVRPPLRRWGTGRTADCRRFSARRERRARRGRQTSTGLPEDRRNRRAGRAGRR